MIKYLKLNFSIILSAVVLFLAVLKSFNFPYVTLLLFLLFFLSVIFAFFAARKDNFFIGIPVLAFIVVLFSFYSDTYTQFSKGLNIISVIFGVSLFLYALSYRKIISKEISAVMAVFFAVLVLHLIPALNPYLTSVDAFDSHWNYKIEKTVYVDGHVPDYDYSAYPESEWKSYDGRDISRERFLHAVFTASAAEILSPLGISPYDTAMLFGGLVAALTAVLFYLFLREIFSDFRQSKYAALIGSFSLGFSFAYASKAVSGSFDAETLGLLLMIGSFFLIFMSFRKRNLKYVIPAGFSFFLFSLCSEYEIAVNALLFFIPAYAVINFIHKKNCTEHVFYIAIPVLFSLFTPLILHPHGSFPDFIIPAKILFFLPIAVFIAFLLELIRLKTTKKTTKNHEENNNSVGRSNSGELNEENTGNFYKIFAAVALIALLASLFSGDYISNLYSKLTQKEEIVFADYCCSCVCGNKAFLDDFFSHINIAYNLMVNGGGVFGLIFICGLFMIPLLVYFAISKRSIGSIIALSLGIPAIISPVECCNFFVKSFQIVCLGSTIGLLLFRNESKWKKIISFTALFLIVLMLFQAFPFQFNPDNEYISSMNKPPALEFIRMHTNPEHTSAGYSSDMLNQWMPALQWLNENAGKEDMILTWWDYGFLITPISERNVLIDNAYSTPAEKHQIQEVARFFMQYHTEDEAMKIIEKYNVKYVVIDETLLGKSSVLHFVANADLENRTPEYNKWLSSYENPYLKTYGVCSFAEVEEKVEKSEDDGMEKVNKVYYQCGFPPNKTQMKDYVGQIEFDIGKKASETNPSELSKYVKAVKVRGLTTNAEGEIALSEEVSWEDWIKEHNSSILGLYSFEDIISCALLSQEQLQKQNSSCQFPMYRELVYAPDEFQNFMFTKLYLGEYAESYAKSGLCNAEWCRNISKRLENFRMVHEASNGYVRIYEVVSDGKER